MTHWFVPCIIVQIIRGERTNNGAAPLAPRRAARLTWDCTPVANESYPWLPENPAIIPGSDAAGEIISTGPSAKRFRAVDRVPGVLPSL